MWIILLIAFILYILYGLIQAGRKYNWGPFSFLHTWQQDVAAIEKSHPVETSQNGIVFYGASNFSLWKDMEQDLSAYKVQNHAFGGSTDKDLVEYAPRLLYPYNPCIIFFQTGSNDYVVMKGSDDEKVARCMAYKKQMFADLHTQMPDAKFVIMSGLLLPGRKEYTALTQKINDGLKNLCAATDYLYFVDAQNMTFDGSTYADALFCKDAIHLNREGQLLWMKNHIQPTIEALIEQHHIEHLRSSATSLNKR